MPEGTGTGSAHRRASPRSHIRSPVWYTRSGGSASGPAVVVIERAIDQRSAAGEPRPVVSRRRSHARPAVIVQLDGEQVAKQVVFASGWPEGEEVLDRRALARSPGGLEAVAQRVDSQEPAFRDRGSSRVGQIAAHPTTSGILVVRR